MKSIKQQMTYLIVKLRDLQRQSVCRAMKGAFPIASLRGGARNDDVQASLYHVIASGIDSVLPQRFTAIQTRQAPFKMRAFKRRVAVS